MRGLLYIGRAYTGGAVGVAARPTARLIMGCVVGVAGVADCYTGVVQAVFAAWLERFLVFIRSACALI